MKINEVIIIEGMGQTLSFNELEPKHVYLLNKASKDGYVDNVSQDYQRELDELIAARLLDDGGSLTNRGEQIIYYVKKKRAKKSRRSLASGGHNDGNSV